MSLEGCVYGGGGGGGEWWERERMSLSLMGGYLCGIAGTYRSCVSYFSEFKIRHLTRNLLFFILRTW
jgi:hypothetical protein